MRQCGDCQLCCKLLPVRELDKPANTKCSHQKYHAGCAIYKRGMPFSCAAWNCRWLVSDDTHDLSRPDRSHYVIDIMPDHITAENDGVSGHIEVVQIWLDPRYPDAHRDPALRRYLERRAEDNVIGLVRRDSSDAFVLLPPSMTGGGWIEKGGTTSPQHTLMDTIAALQNPARIAPEAV